MCSAKTHFGLTLCMMLYYCAKKPLVLLLFYWPQTMSMHKYAKKLLRHYIYTLYLLQFAENKKKTSKILTFILQRINSLSSLVTVTLNKHVKTKQSCIIILSQMGARYSNNLIVTMIIVIIIKEATTCNKTTADDSVFLQHKL